MIEMPESMDECFEPFQKPRERVLHSLTLGSTDKHKIGDKK